MVDKLPEIVKTQVEAIKNIKIDKVTVWDHAGGNGNGNGTSTANFLSGMMGSVPPLKDLLKMSGLDLPEFLARTAATSEQVKQTSEHAVTLEQPKA